METQIRKNDYRYFHLIDIINNTISRGIIRNAKPVANAKIKKSTKREVTIKVSENPAAYYPLG